MSRAVPFPATPGVERRRPRPLASIATLIMLAIARGRQRRCLAALDERLLRDIGRDRLAVRQECAKPPWRA